MTQRFLRCVKVPNNTFASSFVLKSEKLQRIHINYCSKHTVKSQWSYTSVWFRPFKKGRPSVERDPLSVRPSTSRNEEMIAKVRKIFRNNRRLTVRKVVDDCGISVGSCDAILTDDLHMKRVCAKFVPRLLTDDQHK